MHIWNHDCNTFVSSYISVRGNKVFLGAETNWILHINELKPEILRAAVSLKVGDLSTERILRKKMFLNSFFPNNKIYIRKNFFKKFYKNFCKREQYFLRHLKCFFLGIKHNVLQHMNQNIYI